MQHAASRRAGHVQGDEADVTDLSCVMVVHLDICEQRGNMPIGPQRAQGLKWTLGLILPAPQVVSGNSPKVLYLSPTGGGAISPGEEVVTAPRTMGTGRSLQ